MMDEAFIPMAQILERMLWVGQEIVDEDAGIRSYVHECAIESPVELNVFRDEDGTLRIGTTPPLYYVDTSLRPSYHRLKFMAQLTEDVDGN